MDAMSEKPIGIAIVGCDRVITEALTNNKTLVSTFNQISAQSFPCRRSLSVYVALSNASGEKQVELILRREDQSMLKVGGKVKFDHPNHVIELIFNLKNVVFPTDGTYAFEIHADEEYVFESRFGVTKKAGV